MHSSQLFATLKTLSKVQWEELDRFVRSPFFNLQIEKKASPALELFKFISARFPDFDHTDFNKISVNAHMSKLGYPPSRLGKTMNELLSLVRKYLAHYIIHQEDPCIEKLALAKFYQEQGWENKFLKVISGVETEYAELKNKNDLLFFRQFNVQQERHYFEMKQDKREGALNLPNVINELDTLYLVFKWKYTCLLEQQLQHSGSSFPELLIDDLQLKEILPKNIHLPMFQVYKSALDLIRVASPDEIEETFKDYKETLETHSDSLPLADLKHLNSFLRNFCVKCYNSGKNEYLLVLFEVYKYQLEKGYILDDGALPSSSFFNIVSVALKLKEYEWVEDFLNKKKYSISKTEKPEEVYNLNLANYYFHIKNYDKSWVLIKGNYEVQPIKRAAKRLEIKILFEQRDHELLDARISAFKAYVSRTSAKLFPVGLKKMNNNFINIVSQMIHPKTYKNLERIQKMGQKLQKLKSVAEREWLLEKLEELKP